MDLKEKILILDLNKFPVPPYNNIWRWKHLQINITLFWR